MNEIKTDCLIIGAGPCGIFQIFELGLLGISAHIIDTLPMTGGQCSYLYPDKPIFDIPAHPSITGKELIDSLLEQVKPFDYTMQLSTVTQNIEKHEEGYRVTTNNGIIIAKTISIAAGIGAFSPRKPKLEGIDIFEKTNLHYRISRIQDFADKKVFVAGGGDSAIDWALQLVEQGAQVTLVHRSDSFRAAESNVEKYREYTRQGKAELITGAIINYQPDEKGDRLKSLEIKEANDTMHTIEAKEFLFFWGNIPNMKALLNYGLEFNKNQIKVTTDTFQTNLPHIFAIGDCCYYPGKRKLILSGFHEAALVAHAVERILFPDRKQYNLYTTTSTVIHKRLKLNENENENESDS